MATCDVCGRERTENDGLYSPLQAITGAPFGWYSDDDSELCPEDFTKLYDRANGG